MQQASRGIVMHERAGAMPRPVGRSNASQSVQIERLLQDSTLRHPSSLELGWRNVEIERRTSLPSAKPELEIDRHFLMLWHQGAAEGEVQGRLGRFRWYRKAPNTITSCVPGPRPALRNPASQQVIVAALAPEFLLNVRNELSSGSHENVAPLYGANDPVIRNLLLLLLQESESSGLSGPLYSDSLTMALATRYLISADRGGNPLPSKASALPQNVLRRVVELMEDNIEGSVDLAALASESGYSRAHFLRMFRAATGQTPHHYLTTLRLERAKKLMTSTTLSLVEIALACGFSSHSHFATAFRSAFGAVPSVFRRGV
jgi:AraC family transcriptional regulator